MPGSSLWLVPLEDSELFKTIHELTIASIPSMFPDSNAPPFYPHITLTSNVLITPALQPSNPEEWLESIVLSDGIENLRVVIGQVEVGEVFFKKVTMRCDRSRELCELAAVCRAAGVEGVDSKGAKKWVDEEYLPHCSLM